jgi:hypothetical protein
VLINGDWLGRVTLLSAKPDCMGLNAVEGRYLYDAYNHLFTTRIHIRTTRHAIQLPFDISANTLEIRTVQSPKFINLLLTVRSTARLATHLQFDNSANGIEIRAEKVQSV